MCLRDVVENYLNQEQAEEFAFWAFGNDFKNFSHQEVFLEKWNELHGDLLFIYGYGMINEDIPKMIQIWQKQK